VAEVWPKCGRSVAEEQPHARGDGDERGGADGPRSEADAAAESCRCAGGSGGEEDDLSRAHGDGEAAGVGGWHQVDGLVEDEGEQDAVAWLQEQQGRHCELDAGDEGGRRVQHEPAQGGEGREEGLEAGEELRHEDCRARVVAVVPRGSELPKGGREVEDD